MIGFLQGTLFSTHENEKASYIYISVHGVGYKVFVPQRILSEYKKNDEIFLYTFHRLAENVSDLYGMKTEEELAFFELLLSVSGIGPRSALQMSEMSFSEIERAIEEEDLKFLTKVPGVGKKTASRLILELKGKLPEIVNAGTSENNTKKTHAFSDIICMLEGLGFLKKDIEKVLENIPAAFSENNASDEEITKYVLSQL